jgi:pyridinium-3,5-biscarboxylic acid mononucleotide sulfurtransferase
MERAEKLRALKACIASKGSMLISYSGGVDSSLLAAIAKEVLGRNSMCVLLDSPVVPGKALNDAELCARNLGLTLEIVQVPLLEDEQFRKNSTGRCYICKKISAKVLKEKAKEFNMACIADGINVSDLGEHRPGLAASNEEGFVHPFIETRIKKEEIRAIARDLGYEFWKKPSAACLSSRIPYGEEITVGDLKMVEDAEDFLSRKGFSQFRVRNHRGVARIEVVRSELDKLMKIRKELSSTLKKIGFSYVTVDLDGYRSGSMDEILITK